MIVDIDGDANGRKYSVNGDRLDTDPTIACGVNPNWVQALATFYGLRLPAVQPGADAGRARRPSRIRARARRAGRRPRARRSTRSSARARSRAATW